MKNTAETKFKKGNWFIKESKFKNTDIVCATVLMTDLKFDDPMRSPVICDMYGQATEDGKANAKLLAAAPDMFNVLLELQEYAEYWSEYDVPLGIVDRIKNALDKAQNVCTFK